MADPPISKREAPNSAVRASGDLPSPSTPTPLSILLLAAWVGLVAGFLDLGLLVLKTRVIEGDFYRLGEDYRWIIPSGVAALCLLPGALLALLARLRRSAVSLGVAVGLPALLAFLDLCSRLPLEFWAASLLSGGLTVQSARLARRGGRPFLRFVARTTPMLIGAVLAIALTTAIGRVRSEHRALSALPPPPAGRANVLLIVWDTVRASNLSIHGYGRRTTPQLERLAARGVRFEHAFATSSWTLPSHASLFTGRWAHELTAGWKSPLDDTHPTLAERLRSTGYDTAGFVANLDYCGRETGLARGFTHYEDYPLGVWEVLTRYIGLGRRIDRFSLAFVLDKLMGGHRGASSPLLSLSKEHAKRGEEVDRPFLDWLSWQHKRGRPFFAFLNYADAHSPYEVPDPSAPAFGLRPSSWRDRSILTRWLMLDKTTLPYRDIQMAIDVYDDSIAYLDARLGVLLEELRRRGVLDDTLVIVTSDHGEHLGDHLLFFHGCSLYRQLVEVPLVIVAPKGSSPGRVVDEPVSLRDIPATVLDYLGLNDGSPFPGRPLARFHDRAGSADPPESEPLLMEAGKPLFFANQGREPAARGPMRSVVVGGLHYIRSGDGREELFSLVADPEERRSLGGLPGARGVLESFRSLLRSTTKAMSP